MKKILITGAAGFIGSHLTETLNQKGYDVKTLVRYNSRNNWGWLENTEVRDKIDVISGDIRDYDSVYNAMKGCSVVFHLAALIGIPYSYISPKAYIETNITGTYNVLQAAKELGVEQVLVTSTSETYGTAQYVPIDEKHPLVGQSPYSASKISADHLAISYYRSFNLPVKIVRPFNTYGPRQSARAVIPTIITQIISGKKNIKLGNTKPTRDLTYVQDTVNGFYEIYKSDKLFGDVTNVGMNEEISVGDLVLKISSILNTQINIESDDIRVRPEKSEVERLRCNNAKLLADTNWEPQHDLDKGLKETIAFIEKNIKLYKTDLYNV